MTDLGVLLARHGYRGVAVDRLARSAGDTYASTLLGRRTVVIGEPEGAESFYDETLAARSGAVPPPLGWLLFGRGAVHGTDGTAHRDRKRLFLDVVDPPGLDPLLAEVRSTLVARSARWPGREVDLHHELASVYGTAVLRWAGLDLPRREAERVSTRLAEIVDGFGLAGPAYARGWRARLWADRWAAGLVRDVRAGRSVVAPGTAVHAFAESDLDARTAGVELLNVLRPTVAVSWLGAFVPLALGATTPEQRSVLGSGAGDRERFAFAQEVRRTTPFVPALTARAVRDARVSGVPARSGDRLLLDVIGIDHHPARWPDPHRFVADRFLDHGAVPPPLAFELVPQGGGHVSGHRCPGESLTLRLLCETVRVLAGFDADLDGTIPSSRMPTLPAGIDRVRLAPVAAPVAGHA